MYELIPNSVPKNALMQTYAAMHGKMLATRNTTLRNGFMNNNHLSEADRKTLVIPTQFAFKHTRTTR
jgi:hypothetical protein